MQTCAVDTPQKKNSSSHLLDVGVSENGTFYIGILSHILVLTTCICFIRFPNVCAIYIYMSIYTLFVGVLGRLVEC